MLLIAAALVAWIVIVRRMDGMDDGPGTALGGAGWYLGIWITMMAAMMLPSTYPMVLLHAQVARETSPRPAAATTLFVVGYLLSWTAFGIVAYALYRSVRGFDPAFLAWDRGGPIVAGGAIVAAGIYQLTPLKQVCLRHCRNPVRFVLQGWRHGLAGSLRMGVGHGGWCIGCCWALMLVLFAVGVMSITWMLVLTVVVFAEKILPLGERVAQVIAVVLIGCGVWVAVAPDSVPGLTQPGGMPMDAQMIPAPGAALA